jgi:hypothetical protein
LGAVVATLARKSKLERLAGSMDEFFSAFEHILRRALLFVIFVVGMVEICRALLHL